MEEKIVDYINNIASEKGIAVDRTMDLYDNGILDSMEVILLLNFLDEELNIKFAFPDLKFENFKTIDTILAWIEKRQN